MKKTMTFLLSFFMILSLFPVKTLDAENIITSENEHDINTKNVSIECNNETLLSNYQIKIVQALEINGIELPLYKQFVNKNNALSQIKNDASDILALLEKTYGLDTLTDSNWQDYYDCSLNYLDSDNKEEWYTEENEQFRILRNFFDIYENTEKNDEIILEVQNSENTSHLLEDEDFLLKLPYNDIEQLNNSKTIIIPDAETASFSSSNAISYAKRYAISRNSSYASFSADCTNFASQIMEAGGQTQEVTSSQKSGWWHKYTVRTHIHSHSHSWTVAHDFVVYFGITGGSSYHRSFSTSLRAGDFIAADFQSDGDWDHMGFVVEKSSNLVTTNGSTYYDYKVAQHTSDYCEWTSSSTNGWETIGIDGGDYRFIRR